MYWAKNLETTFILHVLFFHIYKKIVLIQTLTSTMQISLFYRFMVLLP
jgi:hypothetical protein